MNCVFIIHLFISSCINETECPRSPRNLLVISTEFQQPSLLCQLTIRQFYDLIEHFHRQNFPVVWNVEPLLIDTLILTCLNSNIHLRARLFNMFKNQVRFFRHKTCLTVWTLKKYEYSSFVSLSTSIYRLNMSLLLHSYGHYFLHVCGRKSQGGSLLGVKRWFLLKWGIVRKSDGRWMAHLVAKKVGVPSGWALGFLPHCLLISLAEYW